MDWTDCPIIEQITGKMSGAPVVRGTRMRPQDIVGNAEMGAEWIAEAHGMKIDDVQMVLDFWSKHYEDLPIEYFAPERVAALGITDVDWSGCGLVEQTPDRFSGEPAFAGTPVRVLDLLIHRSEGEKELSRVYDVPVKTVRSVLSYYDRHQRHLAPAL